MPRRDGDVVVLRYVAICAFEPGNDDGIACDCQGAGFMKHRESHADPVDESLNGGTAVINATRRFGAALRVHYARGVAGRRRGR